MNDNVKRLCFPEQAWGVGGFADIRRRRTVPVNLALGFRPDGVAKAHNSGAEEICVII
jgi:hypothetical protein